MDVNMKKNNYNYLVFFFFSLVSLDLFAFSEKFRNQLLTDDYGVLTERDLRRFADADILEPFSWKFTGINYWQCFPTEKTSVSYEKADYDPDQKTLLAIPYIAIQTTEKIAHHYTSRRTYPIDYAKEKVAIWKKLLKNTKYACISGMYINSHKEVQDGKEIIDHGWSLETLKTPKGYDFYFPTAFYADEENG